MKRFTLLLLLAAPFTARAQTEAPHDNAELQSLMEADQADREANDAGTLQWATVAARDSVRLAQTHAILDAGGAQTASDLYNAALVFQHSRASEDIEQAHTLAEQSFEVDGNEDARWLVPRAYDRWQQSLGRPQVYGTQMIGTYPEGIGPDDHDAVITFSLGDADLGAMTDEERATWGLRPAAEILATVACMNREQGGTEAHFEACRAEARAATEARGE